MFFSLLFCLLWSFLNITAYKRRWVCQFANLGVLENQTIAGWPGKHFIITICNIFNKWLDDNSDSKAVLLFIDQHTSHLSFHVSKLYSENGITLIALFPNVTHWLQPMDAAVFRSLKGTQKTAVSTFLEVGKYRFARIMQSTSCYPKAYPYLKSIILLNIRSYYSCIPDYCRNCETMDEKIYLSISQQSTLAMILFLLNLFVKMKIRQCNLELYTEWKKRIILKNTVNVKNPVVFWIVAETFWTDLVDDLRLTT